MVFTPIFEDLGASVFSIRGCFHFTLEMHILKRYACFLVLQKGRIWRLIFLGVGGAAISSTANLFSTCPPKLYRETWWLLSWITQGGLKIDCRVSLIRSAVRLPTLTAILPPFFGTRQSILIFILNMFCWSYLGPWNYQEGSFKASKGALQNAVVSWFIQHNLIFYASPSLQRHC